MGYHCLKLPESANEISLLITKTKDKLPQFLERKKYNGVQLRVGI